MSKRGSCRLKALTLKGVMIAQSYYIDECCVELETPKIRLDLFTP